MASGGVRGKRRALSCDNGSRKRTYPNVQTSNRFSLLDNSGPSRRNNAPAAPKRPAPLTITNKNADLMKVLENSGVKYNFKILGIGTKIFCENEKDRTSVEKLLSDNNMEYFTHPYGEQNSFKVILSGLPLIDTALILNGLKEKNNIKPLSITLLNGTRDNRLYLLQYNRSETSRTDSNNIRIVYNHVVKWLPFKARRKGPTQCYKCGMFGHGATYCDRNVICLTCGENHLTKDCPLDQSDSHVIFKCANCSAKNLPANHKATDGNCPARAEYVNIRVKVNNPRSGQNDGSNNVNYSSRTSANVTFADALKNSNTKYTAMIAKHMEEV